MAGLVGSRTVVTALGLTAIAALAAVDYSVGRELGLSVFYAVPVFLVSRRAGLLPGLGIAVTAAIAWAIADLPVSASNTRSWIHYWNAFTRFSYFVLAVAAARMRSGLELEVMRARRDPLTGLLNRRGFLEAARREVERSRRYGRPLTIAYLDCDDFKVVNDTRGHEAGDRLLRAIAGVMRASLRALDVPARLGGDEFVLLLPETSAREARDTLERLMVRLRIETTEQPWAVTFSVGVVTFVRPPASVESILHTADRLMYRAKQRGKSRLEQDVIGPSGDADWPGTP
jgi:diguanylate cyclase (GGDEF)-like protein